MGEQTLFEFEVNELDPYRLGASKEVLQWINKSLYEWRVKEIYKCMDKNKLNIPESIFEKTVGRKRSPQMTLLIALGLFLVTFVIGYLEFGFPDLFIGGQWRNIFVNPSIIFYILLIAPILTDVEDKVIQEFIKLGELTDEKIQQIHEDTHAIEPWREWLSIGVGVIIVLALFGGSVSLDLTGIYLLIISLTAFGLLSWTVYSSVVSVRVTSQLLKQPLKVDLFNLEPYKVVGKSSLYLALAFIGGFTLALLFTGADITVVQSFEFWIVNMYMFILPFIIFFWNMYPTYKIIDSEKKDALNKVGQQIRRLKDRMLADTNLPDESTSLSQSLQGYIALEERLEKVQSWPYEVSTLRSLMGSILIPVITVVGQVVLRNLLGW